VARITFILLNIQGLRCNKDLQNRPLSGTQALKTSPLTRPVCRVINNPLHMKLHICVFIFTPRYAGSAALLLTSAALNSADYSTQGPDSKYFRTQLCPVPWCNSKDVVHRDELGGMYGRACPFSSNAHPNIHVLHMPVLYEHAIRYEIPKRISFPLGTFRGGCLVKGLP
jgi:hypothetical protein